MQLFLQSVPSFEGTSLNKLLWQTKPYTKRQANSLSGIARAGWKSDYTIIEKTCQVGDHLLDDLSTYIIRRTYNLISNHLPLDWDPLAFLPLNIQSNLHKNEALVSAYQIDHFFFNGSFILPWKMKMGWFVKAFKFLSKIEPSIDLLGIFNEWSSQALCTSPCSDLELADLLATGNLITSRSTSVCFLLHLVSTGKSILQVVV